MLYAGSNLDKARRIFERTSKHRPRTLFLSDLAKAYADLGQFDDAWRDDHDRDIHGAHDLISRGTSCG